MTEDEENKVFKLTPKQNRIIEGSIRNYEDDKGTITYSHSTMCQTSLPFKNQGDIREWKSRNGKALILIEAGQVYDPETNDAIKVGLPYGAKPRLILLYFNSQAIKQQSPEITIENSLYAFIKRIGFASNGRVYSTVKDQLGRLAASHITIGRTEADGSGTTSYGRIVDKMNVLFSRDEYQRTLWPNTVRLSDDYFQSLTRHAVPLDEKALYLLKDSALELDLYAMLAERLHRIPENKPQFIPWSALYDQYGKGYSRIRKFRSKFLNHLRNVHAVYPTASLEETKNNNGNSKGLTLFHSEPPVLKKNVFILPPLDDK